MTPILGGGTAPWGFPGFSRHTRKTPGKYQENTRRSVFDLVGAQTDVKPRSFLVFSWAKVAAGWICNSSFPPGKCLEDAWKMPGMYLESASDSSFSPGKYQECAWRMPGVFQAFPWCFPRRRDRALSPGIFQAFTWWKGPFPTRGRFRTRVPGTFLVVSW